MFVYFLCTVFLVFIRFFPRFAYQRVVSSFRKSAVARKRVQKIGVKKQGKSHIPLEHFDPNFINVLSFANKIACLANYMGRGFSYLLTCAMFS